MPTLVSKLELKLEFGISLSWKHKLMISILIGVAIKSRNVLTMCTEAGNWNIGLSSKLSRAKQ